MISRVEQKAGDYFNNGFMCAESVLLAVCEEFNFTSDLVPKIATGFSAGISRCNDTCGAVCGGILALNLFFGRNNRQEDRELNFKLVQEFRTRFTHQFGTMLCTELTGCDLSTEEGGERFEQEGMIERCHAITSKAAGLVTDIIKSNLDK